MSATQEAYYDTFDKFTLIQTPSTRAEMDKWNTVINETLTATLCASKLSLMFFYLRLSKFQGFRYTVFALMGYTMCYSLMFAIVYPLIFSPVGPQVRQNIQVVLLVYGISNILMDFSCLALPIHIIFPLKMSVKKKVCLLILFSAGVIVCATAVWRTSAISLITKNVVTEAKMSRQSMLAIAEANLSTICAAVPVCTRFFTTFVPEVYRSLLSNSSKNDSPATLSPVASSIERNKLRQERSPIEVTTSVEVSS